MTAFASIQTALLAALTASPALASGNISTNRQRPIPAGQSTAIVLRLDQSDGTEMVLGALDWNTAYTVECYARGSTATTEMVAAVDTLLAAVWARLAALTYEALGADIAVNPRIDWQYDDGETPLVCAVIRITCSHRTSRSTLTAWN
jgi:hypothetical protein